MLPILLALAATLLAAQIEPTKLRHAEVFAFSLGPEDPALEGVGPARTFHYTIESADAVVLVFAESAELDLVLQAKLDTAEGPAAAATGPAALLGGRKREDPLRDDDSGGGTTPFLRIPHQGGGPITLWVAVKSPSTEGSATIHVFEAIETPATRSAVREAGPHLAEAQQSLRARDLGSAREHVQTAFDLLSALAGAARSEAIASMLFQLGTLAFHSEAQPLARSAWETADAFRGVALPETHADSLGLRSSLAAAVSATGDHQAAKRLNERVLEICEAIYPAEHPAVQATRMNLSTELSQTGDLRGARKLLEQILEIYERTLPPDHGEKQKVRLNLAVTLKNLGLPREAVIVEAKAVEVYERTLPPEHPNLQRARVNLAATLLWLGRYDEAKAIEQSVLRVFAKTLPPEHADYQRARMNHAVTLGALGESHTARALLEQVLAIRERTLPREHRALQSVRLNLAEVLVDLGDLHTARALMEQVLEIRSRTLPNDHIELQSARQALAALNRVLGRLGPARTLLETCLASYDATFIEKGDAEVQSVRVLLGAVLRDQGQLDAAQATLEQVIDSWPEDLPDYHATLMAARSHLAGTHRLLGAFQQSLVLVQRNYNLAASRLPDNHAQLRAARTNLAWSLAHIGQIEASRRLAIEQLDAAIHSHRGFGGFSSRELEAHGNEWRQEIQAALSLLLGAGIFDPDEAGLTRLFEATEAIRTAPTTSARLIRVSEDDPTSVHLRTELATVHREISRLSDQNETGAALFEAIRRRDQHERRLAEHFAARGGQGRIPSLDPEVIRARLQPGEAALALWRADIRILDAETRLRGPAVPSYFAWVLRYDAPMRWLSLGPAAPIEAAAAAWRSTEADRALRGVKGRRAVGKKEEEQLNAASSLARALIDPLKESLEDVDRLYVAPAGALHGVPLDALPQDGGYLGDALEIITLEGLSLLTVEAAVSPATVGLLAMGGIDYDAEEETPEPPRADADVDSLRTRLSATTAFEPLAQTASEAEAIAEIYEEAVSDDRPSLLLTGSEATRERFEADGPRAQFLHIATHGWFSDIAGHDEDAQIREEITASPSDRIRGLAPSLLCGLAFAGANGRASDLGRLGGVLTAEEIRALDLGSVELAILSACETSLGERRGAQGIASLQAALHAAGVRTTITSLWKVPDAATRELMTEFYRRLWILKEPKAKALWNAKKALRERLDDDGTPIYSFNDWAGWVLSGDPD